MSVTSVLEIVLAVVLLLVGPVIADEPDPLLAELAGQAPAAVRAADALPAAYEQAYAKLLPGLTADDLAARAAAQKQLELIVFNASRPNAEPERQALSTVLCGHVGADAPRLARVWLLRQLILCGGAEAVAPLTKLLDESDPELRDLARRALQTNPDKAAVAALRTALSTATDATWKIGLVNALGARQDRESVAALTGLARGTDMAVARAAIAALGDVADGAARSTLDWLWTDGAEELRPAVADARLRAADSLFAHGQNEAAQWIYEDLFLPTAPEQVRMGALRGLASVHGAAATDMLLQLVLKGDPGQSDRVRTLAADLLGAVDDPNAAAALAAALLPADAAGRVLLLRALAGRSDVHAMPAILPLLRSQSPEVQQAAVETLARIGDETAATSLAQLAADTSGALQEQARRALLRLRGAKVDTVMLTAVAESNATLACELLRALAARRHQPAIGAILTQLKRAEPAVRVAALEALAILGTTAEAPAAVAALLAADDDTVPPAAENTAVALCERTKPADAAPVLAAWDAAAAPQRAALLRVLARLGGAAALERVRAAQRLPEAEVADAAVRALAAWSTPDALPDLRKLAEESTSQVHRVLALQGYVRLLPLATALTPAELLARYQEADKLAQRTEERRLILAGVAKVCDAHALPWVQTKAADPELRAEAEAALVSLAQVLASVDFDAARATIERLQTEAASEATRKRAGEVRADIDKYRGVIALWVYSGPYLEAGRDWAWVFDQAFAPEQNPASVEWKPLPITDPEKPWYVDLTQVEYGAQRCMYLAAKFNVPEGGPARLELGSDDGIKVWLNGELVHEFRGIRGHTPLQDKAPITLRKGENSIMVKVVQEGGDWGMSCVVRGANGDPLPTITVRAAAP